LLFISFAESVEFDHSFLLDLLISSETRFLEYFVQYLHFVIAGWSSFVQCLVEYKETISCTAEEGMSDEVGMCSVRLREFESDFNSSETPSEIETRVANEMRSNENDLLFARQEPVTGEDGNCSEMPNTFPKPQNNSLEKFETGPEFYQSDSRLQGTTSGGLNGLASIVLAYSSSDESEVENEDEDESVNDHKTLAVSRADSIICGSVCFSNNQRGSSSFDTADSTEMFHSSFSSKSCSALLQNVSGTPRKHTSNLNDSAFPEHQGFYSNQPNGDSNLNLGYQNSSCRTKLRVPLSSDKNTEIFVNRESHIERSVTKPTAVKSELLDQVMTMLIRLRLSVTRLSSGGHFPYSAVPLISLMENVEKCYDGC